MHNEYSPMVHKTPIGFTVSVGEGTHLEAVCEAASRTINIEDISVAAELRDQKRATRMVAALAGLALRDGYYALHSCWTHIAGWHLHRRIFGSDNVQTVWERHQGSVLVGDIVPQRAVPSFFDSIADHEKECIARGVEPSKCLAINVDLTSHAVHCKVTSALHELSIDRLQLRTVEMDEPLQAVGAEVVRLVNDPSCA